MYSEEKSPKKIYKSIAEIPVFYPYPLGFDDSWCTQYRPLPDWLSKWRGVISGETEVISVWCSWCWFILSCKIIWILRIISSLITRDSLQGLFCLKNVKTNKKKVTKKWKKWYCHFTKKRSCCGTKQDREYSSGLFSSKWFLVDAKSEKVDAKNIFGVLTHMKSGNFHCLNGFLSRNEYWISSNSTISTSEIFISPIQN